MQLRDLSRQYQALRPALEEAILKVASGGSYIMGDVVEELEQRLAQYVGVKHCISCGNGTDALRLALMAWGVGEGDAVFVPDFTFFATAEAVALQGATPVFVDVREDTFNMDARDLQQKILQLERAGVLHPKAIVAVDLFGQPAAFPALRSIARQYDMLLLEDSAQGFGGSIKEIGRACSFGDIAITSFFPAKPLGCFGDGGALFTDNDGWAALLRSLRVHGKGSDKYHNMRLGLNSRLDAIQAAVLLVKLKALTDYELAAVNDVAKQYDSALAEIVMCPAVPEGYLSSWAQYTIRLRTSYQRDIVQQHLKAHGIPSAIYYPVPMHRQPVFANDNLLRRSDVAMQEGCPVTSQLCGTVLSIPMHPYLTSEEISLVCETIHATLS